MKKVILVLLCAASITAVNAQVKFGIKAGANFASLSGDNDGLKMKIGINGGVQVGFNLSETISLNPELVFSTQGAKEDGGDGKLKLGYINLPILLQYNNPSGFFAHTGPQIGFLMSAKSDDGTTEEDIKDGLKSTDFAWAFGAGFATQSGVGFNARYNLGLSNIIDEGSDLLKWKNSVFQIGLFYNFGGGAAAKASK